jgi:hypothetical protein
MTNRTYVYLAIAALLGGLYAFRFADFSRGSKIQINVATRPFLPNPQPGDILPVVFGFDSEYRLTAVSVLPAASETNKSVAPLWTQVAPKGSAPVRGFVYGLNIPGMDPAPNGIPKLEPGASYRIHVEAGSAHGDAQFQTRGAVEPN